MGSNYVRPLVRKINLKLFPAVFAERHVGTCGTAIINGRAKRTMSMLVVGNSGRIVPEKVSERQGANCIVARHFGETSP
jgi:hypothetical protein